MASAEDTEELGIRVRTIQEEAGCLVRVQMARKVGGIAVQDHLTAFQQRHL